MGIVTTKFRTNHAYSAIVTYVKYSFGSFALIWVMINQYKMR